MTRELHAPDAVVDWLLSSIAERLYGAVDLGLLQCVDAPPDAFSRFVADHVAEPLVALAAATRLAVTQRAPARPTHPALRVTRGVQEFVAAMSALAGFRDFTAEAVGRAAEDVAAAWAQLRQCVVDAAAAEGVEVSFLRELSPERERAARETLAQLAGELRGALGGNGS